MIISREGEKGGHHGCKQPSEGHLGVDHNKDFLCEGSPYLVLIIIIAVGIIAAWCVAVVACVRKSISIFHVWTKQVEIVNGLLLLSSSTSVVRVSVTMDTPKQARFGEISREWRVEF